MVRDRLTGRNGRSIVRLDEMALHLPARRNLRRALLIVVPLCAYASAAGSGFVWDDHRSLERGRLMGSLRNLPALFRHDTMFNADGGRYQARATLDTYRPLTMTTFLVEHALFGARPLPYHIDSVLIHLANVILLFLLARRVRVSESAALWAALLFAALPAVAEAVHWVNGRSDPLATLFLLAALLAWLEGRGVRTALLVFAATLCKETTFVVLPPLLLLRRYRADPRLRGCLPFVAGAAAGLGVRVAVLHGLAAGAQWTHLRFALARLPALWLDGLRSTLVPVPAMPPTLYEQYRTVSVGASVTALLVLLLLGGGAAWAWRRGRPLPALALASFSLSIAPVSMLTFAAGWSGWGRYLYPSAPFVCLALASLIVDDAVPRARPAVRKLALAAGAALLAVLCLATFAHGRDWRDDRSFAAALVRDHPDQSFGHAALALAELDGDPARAVAAAQRAVALDPRHAPYWSLAANALMRAGRRRDAYRAAERGLALDPGDANCQYVLAFARLDERREEQAARLLAGALAAEPRQPGPWQTLRAAARRLGPRSPFVATLRALAAEPRYAAIAAELSAASK